MHFCHVHVQDVYNAKKVPCNKFSPIHQRELGSIPVVATRIVAWKFNSTAQRVSVSGEKIESYIYTLHYSRYARSWIYTPLTRVETNRYSAPRRRTRLTVSLINLLPGRVRGGTAGGKQQTAADTTKTKESIKMLLSFQPLRSSRYGDPYSSSAAASERTFKGPSSKPAFLDLYVPLDPSPLFYLPLSVYSSYIFTRDVCTVPPSMLSYCTLIIHYEKNDFYVGNY